jgi:hypothetical protein
MHYFDHIYKPLMRLKNEEILEYEIRNDYSQVLATNDSTFTMMNKCILKISKDVE